MPASRAASSRCAARAMCSPRIRAERAMRRLYQKIYRTIIVSLLVVVAVAGTFWRIGFDSTPAGQAFELVGELAAAALPPPNAPPDVQREAVERLAQRL